MNESYQQCTLTGLICLKCGESYGIDSIGFEQMIGGNCVKCEDTRNNRSIIRKIIDWFGG